MKSAFTVSNKLITNNKESRINHDYFHVEMDGYHLFPVNVIFPIQKSEHLAPFGECMIVKVSWESETTYVKYKLISLHSTN